jgi:hypothetical protein
MDAVTRQTLLSLRSRLDHASLALINLATSCTSPDDQRRLLGKNEGVVLAISYLDDELTQLALSEL